MTVYLNIIWKHAAPCGCPSLLRSSGTYTLAENTTNFAILSPSSRWRRSIGDKSASWDRMYEVTLFGGVLRTTASLSPKLSFLYHDKEARDYYYQRSQTLSSSSTVVRCLTCRAAEKYCLTLVLRSPAKWSRDISQAKRTLRFSHQIGLLDNYRRDHLQVYPSVSVASPANSLDIPAISCRFRYSARLDLD